MPKMKLVIAPITSSSSGAPPAMIDQIVGERAGQAGDRQRADDEADRHQDGDQFGQTLGDRDRQVDQPAQLKRCCGSAWLIAISRAVA